MQQLPLVGGRIGLFILDLNLCELATKFANTEVTVAWMPGEGAGQDRLYRLR